MEVSAVRPSRSRRGRVRNNRRLCRPGHAQRADRDRRTGCRAGRARARTTFAVLRRVDFNPDGACTGGTWMMLPPPNAPSFTTSNGGAGALHFEISRGAPLVDAVSFDVQWRLEGSDGSVVQSDCLTVTVK